MAVAAAEDMLTPAMLARLVSGLEDDETSESVWSSAETCEQNGARCQNMLAGDRSAVEALFDVGKDDGSPGQRGAIETLANLVAVKAAVDEPAAPGAFSGLFRRPMRRWRWRLVAAWDTCSCARTVSLSMSRKAKRFLPLWSWTSATNTFCGCLALVVSGEKAIGRNSRALVNTGLLAKLIERVPKGTKECRRACCCHGGNDPAPFEKGQRFGWSPENAAL